MPVAAGPEGERSGVLNSLLCFSTESAVKCESSLLEKQPTQKRVADHLPGEPTTLLH